MGRRAIVIKPTDFENLINFENKIKVIVGDYGKTEEFGQIIGNNNSAVNEKLLEALSTLDNLQKQIDGEVTAWFIDGAPCDKYGTITSDKEPTCDWSENGEDGKDTYASHEGDTYTDITTFVDDKTTPTAGQSWRFCYCERVKDARGNKVTDWHWHKIADSDAVKALQEAGRAQVTADGKATVFISRTGKEVPTNYQIGDMWFINQISLDNGNLGSDITIGDLLTANVSNTGYNSSDWSKHLKYTDDTMAEQAILDAQNAVVKANEAHAEALIALEGLSDVRADGRVYKDEMKQLEIRKYDIVEERNELVGEDGKGGEAAKWSASVNYADEYYVAANNAIESLNYYSDKSNVDESEEFIFDYITIDKSGAPKWSNITSYYTERQKLLSQIADATKAHVESVETLAEQARALSNAAQDAADTAYISAEKSLKQLDEIDNDKVIAKTEFAVLETQLEDIEEDLEEIRNSINVYNDSSVYAELSNEFEVYKSAHYNAINTLKYHCGKEVGEVPQTATTNEYGSILIKSTTIKDADRNVVFNEVNVDYDNISAYYAKRQSILNLIAQKARVYAESLQMELSPENIEELLKSVKIGGVNIIKNSRSRIFHKLNGDNSDLTVSTDNNYSSTKLNTNSELALYNLLYHNTTNDTLDVNDITDMQWGGEYVTASIDVNIPRASVYTAHETHSNKLMLEVIFMNGDKELFRKTQSIDDLKTISYDRWNRLTFTWKMDKDVSDTYKGSDNVDYFVDKVYFGVKSFDIFKANTTIKFKNTQFEFATTASSWSPAPEDVESGIENAYSIAEDAKQNADSARQESYMSLETLNAMADDSIITPQEKIQIKKEWDEIKYDYQQAYLNSEQIWDNNGIEKPVEWEVYDEIYNTLDTYLKQFYLEREIDYTNNGDDEFLFNINLLDKKLELDGQEYGGREGFNKIFAMYYASYNAYMSAIAEQLAHLEVLGLDTKITSEIATIQGQANAASDAAANAKTEAEAAKARLENWASDSVISPFEKSGILDELERITADKLQITSGCTYYGITDDSFIRIHTIYENVLNDIITNLTSKGNKESIPVPSNFRTNQNSYYTTRTNFLQRFSEAAQEKAEEFTSSQVSGLAEQSIAAKTAAAQAVQAAANAQNQAQAASDRLTTWASDGVISPLERSGLQDELARVNADYEQISGQSVFYGVSLQTFNNVYVQYKQLLSDIIEDPEEIINVPDGFRELQSEYYNVRATILNTISETADAKAQEYSDNVYEYAKEGLSEAKAKADAAANAAASAQTQANEAKERLTAWASDGVISPVEKMSIIDELTRINSDYVQISGDCQQYSIALSTHSFKTFYDNYKSNLGTITASTTETVAIPSNFKTNQSNYYSARTSILRTISSKAEEKAEEYATTAYNNALTEIASANAYAKSLNDALQTSLQNQIDGVVDSYFMEGAPTTSNAPAKDWTTDALKARHEGDTYTNINSSEKDNTGGQSWRWCRGNTTGDNVGWHWHKIADSDAVKALQEAASAKATADGKLTMFTSQPTPPYKVGDLWIETGATNDTLYCKVAKTAGQSFASSDWASSTAAKKALETANSAATAAAEAATEAKAAEYLTAVLNSGSTDITGGLVLTNVLQLKDMNGNVTAGMSGLDKFNQNGKTYEEDVLMWGGGTYSQARVAASGDYTINSTTGEKIKTLLKKDGNAKIGLFEIDSNKAVVNDTDNVERIVLTSNDVKSVSAELTNTKESSKTYELVTHKAIVKTMPYELYFTSESDGIESCGDFSTSVSPLSYINVTLDLLYFNICIDYELEEDDEFNDMNTSNSNNLWVYMCLPDGAKIKIAHEVIVLNDYINNKLVYRSLVNNDISIKDYIVKLENYNIKKENINKIKILFETDIASADNITLNGELKWDIICYLQGTRTTILGNNGISINGDSGAAFSVTSEYGKTNITWSKAPEEPSQYRNQMYIMSYGNGEFIDALKQQSNYLVDISDNLRMFFLQFSDLANYLSELCTNLNDFASATKNIFGDNNVNSAYTKLQNSITKVTNCLKNSSSKTDTYIGIDEEERYGMLTERSTKKGLPSGTKLPLHDLASAKDEVKRTKWNYLYSLSQRSQSLSDKLQETKLVSL